MTIRKVQQVHLCYSAMQFTTYTWVKCNIQVLNFALKQYKVLVHLICKVKWGCMSSILRLGPKYGKDEKVIWYRICLWSHQNKTWRLVANFLVFSVNLKHLKFLIGCNYNQCKNCFLMHRNGWTNCLKSAGFHHNSTFGSTFLISKSILAFTSYLRKLFSKTNFDFRINYRKVSTHT